LREIFTMKGEAIILLAFCLTLILFAQLRFFSRLYRLKRRYDNLPGTMFLIEAACSTLECFFELCRQEKKTDVILEQILPFCQKNCSKWLFSSIFSSFFPDGDHMFLYLKKTLTLLDGKKYNE